MGDQDVELNDLSNELRMSQRLRHGLEQQRLALLQTK